MRSQLLIPITQRLTSIFPPGGSLPEDVWQKRYSVLLGLTWFHAAIIALVGPLLGYSREISAEAPFHDGTVLHTILEGTIVGFFAGLGSLRGVGRTLQATAIAMGLMSSSAILVHLSGGYIEFHFHFFVMLSFLALLQDWVPYILAILYVALHHGIVGDLWPKEVSITRRRSTRPGPGPASTLSSCFGPVWEASSPGGSTKSLWIRLKSRPRNWKRPTSYRPTSRP